MSSRWVTGPPVVSLHGSSTSSVSLLPLLERIDGVRALAVDRPGFGLSERVRAAAVEFGDEVLDALELETCWLAGQSMGGRWAVWYALAQPDRVRGLALLGSASLLPGTRPSAPLRLTATPIVGSCCRRSSRIGADELRRLTVPTLLIWGDHDPVAAVEAAHATAEAVPDVRLEVLPAGHEPYLAHPERVSELLSDFVRSGSVP